MEAWTHSGVVYQVTSGYALPDDAWTYELTGPYDPPGRVCGLAVLIPDATPDDASFTPMNATHAQVITMDGTLPRPVALRFLRSVEASGDLVSGDNDGTVIGDLALSANTWHHADRRFEVNSYHSADHDCWCYELYEVDPPNAANHFIEVRIPDQQPASGPFVPATADHARLISHGSWTLPWLVFRHFLDAVADDRLVVDKSAGHPTPSHPGTPDESCVNNNRSAVSRWAPTPASNPAPPDLGLGQLALILAAAGPTPITLIKHIRQITGFGLLDSRALLDRCPSVVLTGLNETRAATCADLLRSAGASVEVRSQENTA